MFFISFEKKGEEEEEANVYAHQLSFSANHTACVYILYYVRERQRRRRLGASFTHELSQTLRFRPQRMRHYPGRLHFISYITPFGIRQRVYVSCRYYSIELLYRAYDTLR